MSKKDYENLNALVDLYKTLVNEYSALQQNETSELNTLAKNEKLNEINTNKETINQLINDSSLLKCISNINKYAL
jgi:hypothetical protein